MRQPRQHYDQMYNRYRRELRGPDPRHTARWRRLRTIVLNANPLCQDPHGIHARTGQTVEATQVDHIRSIQGAPGLVYALDNLQALCSLCHGIKSGRERRKTNKTAGKP